MVTFLSHCCWPGRRVFQSPECWISCNVQGKMREGGEDDDKGMVNDVEGVRSLVKSVNCVPVRQLKICWRMALLSLYGHWDGEKANG